MKSGRLLKLILASFAVLAVRIDIICSESNLEQAHETFEWSRIREERQNQAVQRQTLHEWERSASTIGKQLEALSYAPEDRMSSTTKRYRSDMYADLKRLEEGMNTLRDNIELQEYLLEEEERQLRVRSGNNGNVMESIDPHAIISHANRVSEQQDLMNKTNLRASSALAAHSRSLMEDRRISGPSKCPPQILANSSRIALEASELELCMQLEHMMEQEGYDIAEVNLKAAEGLPGTAEIDADKSIKMIDMWAAWVKRETERHLYKFKANPGDYHDSEAYFRILMMVCVLQEDFKVRYHTDPKMRAGEIEVGKTDYSFYEKPQDIFIHGITGLLHQGTCASLPVLYVAVGRKLGYPLMLVTAKGHLFARWEDSKERFNIEGTNRGLNCYPDKEYMEWPLPISKEEVDTGMWLKSLTPKRELAVFLELRALCFKFHGLESKYITTKRYADFLREKEGINLDKVNRLMREQYTRNLSDKADSNDVLLSEMLQNTNSWRYDLGHKRGSNEKMSVFHSDRTDTE